MDIQRLAIWSQREAGIIEVECGQIVLGIYSCGHNRKHACGRSPSYVTPFLVRIIRPLICAGNQTKIRCSNKRSAFTLILRVREHLHSHRMKFFKKARKESEASQQIYKSKFDMDAIEMETSDFITYIRGRDGKRAKYDWVSCTWYPPFPIGFSKIYPGDLQRWLKAEFGSLAVGSTSLPLSFRRLTSLVFAKGKIWTNEDVFWQNQLIDRLTYPVVYRICPSLQG